MTRRDLLKTGILASAGTLAHTLFAQGDKTKMQMNFFSKPLHWMNYEQLSDCLATIGVDGIDLTVRPKGHVLPEKVRTDLPRAVKAAQSRGLKVNMIVTAITSAEDEYARTILETAAENGVEMYRMGYQKYDYKRGVARSLDDIRARFEKLAQLNKKLGLTGSYQNHYAWKPELFGGVVWDLYSAVREIDPREISCQYDIRHAIAESPSSWSNATRVIAPWISSICLKDFDFGDEKNGLPIPRRQPAGEGIVPWKEYLSLLKELKIQVPSTVHLEWGLLSKEESRLPIDHKIRIAEERCTRECAFYRTEFESTLPPTKYNNSKT